MKGWQRVKQGKGEGKRTQKRIILAMMAAFVLVLVLMSTAVGAGVSMRVSTDSSGAQANGGSFKTDVSGDGQFIVFDSDASNLVTGDTNGKRDVFKKNVLTGAITRVSTDSAGHQQYGENPSVSADGRYVAFQSTSNMAGDTNNKMDVFVKDTATGTTTRVSPLYGQNPSISADGRYVAFVANKSISNPNTACGDGGFWYSCVFRYDRQTGITSKVNTGYGANSSISGDGRYIAFNDGFHVNVRDMQGGTSTIALPCDGDDSGETCDGHSAAISADGHHVVFRFNSSNTDYVVVKDLVGGSLTQITGQSESSGQQFASNSISDDGRYVAFYTDWGRTPFVYEVYVRDMIAGTTTKISTEPSGGTSNGSSSLPAISGDGSRVAFPSDASNLIAGDTNGASDIFVVDTGFSGPPPDTTAPVISDIQPSGTLGTSSATVSAYFSDADPSSGIDVASASLTVSGGTVSDCVATAAGITCTVSGLADGEHTINVSVADNEGNTGSGSGSFTVDTCQPAKPALGISSMVPSWASYADYQAGLLTVSLSISNAGPGNAYGLGLVGAVNTMGVTTASGIPGPVGNVEAGTSQSVGVKYQVPAGVGAFKSSIYATAADSCNEIYSYPGPMPGA